MNLPTEVERKFEVIRKLGQGGMGTVFQVRHRLLRHDRVIKVVRLSLADDPQQRARFFREAQAAAQLRSPRIAEIYDYAVDAEGTAYIVMEFLPGMTVAQALARLDRFSPGVAARLATEALEALAYLHAQGFVHRDVAPDNLMLTLDDSSRVTLKLIDLGLAKKIAATTELTSTGMFLGKVRYASPEQFGQGGDEPDARSDIYSMGLVLYEMLTGERAVQGESVNEMVAAHLLHPMRPFADTDPQNRINERLRSVVERALRKSPEDRFDSAVAFAAELATDKTEEEGGVAALVQERVCETQPEVSDAAETLGSGSLLNLRDGDASTAPGAGAQQAGAVVWGADAGSADETAGLQAVDSRVERDGRTADKHLAGVPSRGRLVLWSVTGLVLAVMAVAWWSSRSGVAATSTLVLDASPWAQIRILDEQGSEVAVAGNLANAPTRLAVPPGRYRVAFQSAGGEVRWVELDASDSTRPTSARVDFRSVDTQTQLQELGLLDRVRNAGQ